MDPPAPTPLDLLLDEIGGDVPVADDTPMEKVFECFENH